MPDGLGCMNLLLGAFDAKIGLERRFDGILEPEGVLAALRRADMRQYEKSEKNGNPPTPSLKSGKGSGYFLVSCTRCRTRSAQRERA